MIEPLTIEENKALARASRADVRFDFSMKAGGLLILSAAGCLVWQGYTWLRTADWPAFPFRDILDLFDAPELQFSWAGVQKIADWISGAPAPAVLFCIGMFVLWSAFWGQDSYDSPALNKARSKQALLLRAEQDEAGEAKSG
jgi:hypothetical protein